MKCFSEYIVNRKKNAPYSVNNMLQLVGNEKEDNEKVGWGVKYTYTPKRPIEEVASRSWKKGRFSPESTFSVYGCLLPTRALFFLTWKKVVLKKIKKYYS